MGFGREWEPSRAPQGVSVGSSICCGALDELSGFFFLLPGLEEEGMQLPCSHTGDAHLFCGVWDGGGSPFFLSLPLPT